MRLEDGKGLFNRLKGIRSLGGPRVPPQIARLAYLWGYLNPTKLEKIAIAAAEK